MKATTKDALRMVLDLAVIAAMLAVVIFSDASCTFEVTLRDGEVGAPPVKTGRAGAVIMPPPDGSAR